MAHNSTMFGRLLKLVPRHEFEGGARDGALARVNAKKPWELCRDLFRRAAGAPAGRCRRGTGSGFKDPLYSLDSTVIDLWLSMFPWAKMAGVVQRHAFRRTKGRLRAAGVHDGDGRRPPDSPASSPTPSAASGRCACGAGCRRASVIRRQPSKRGSPWTSNSWRRFSRVSSAGMPNARPPRPELPVCRRSPTSRAAVVRQPSSPRQSRLLPSSRW